MAISQTPPRARVHWQEIDVVLLDMDGTLIDLKFDNQFWNQLLPQRIAEVHRIELSAARALMAEYIHKHRHALPFYCVDAWSDYLQLDVGALKDHLAHLIEFRADALSFLRQLRTLGKRVDIVTNAHNKSIAVKQRVTGIAAHVDQVVSSHTLGWPKEAPQFWSTLRSRFPFEPQRTLFIDDSPPVLQTALKAGLRHVIAVRTPDSSRVAIDHGAIPSLDQFADILPPS